MDRIFLDKNVAWPCSASWGHSYLNKTKEILCYAENALKSFRLDKNEKTLFFTKKNRDLPGTFQNTQKHVKRIKTREEISNFR